MKKDEEEIFFPQTDDVKEPEEEVKETGESDADDEDEGSDEGEDVVGELEKRYMNLYAEYENYRKRTAKEKETLYADAVADVTSQFLAVMDNIDRALQTANNSDENSVENVVKGIEMIGKQTEDVLAKIGVEEIECKRGDAFDPTFHEAVMHVDDDELGASEVAQVFAKGYKYKDKVIRHVVVQVAN